MDIHSLKIEKIGETSERVSAEVGGAEVFFQISGAHLPLRRSYDPFVLAGFLGAMKRGETLHVAEDFPVSPLLIENLGKAMGIYAQWCPGPVPVPIRTGCSSEPSSAVTSGVGSFFSGGVDSIQSFIKNEEAITHLILCRGLDVTNREADRWRQMVHLVREFARERDKGLILVETNVKEHLREKLGVDNHGAILVSTALAIPFDQLIVPASATLSLLLPWGSHPILDPLFSNGTTDVLHDSPIPRTSKIQAIVDTGIGLDCLRVCNVFTRQVNCCECEKCLRTRTAFTLLGRTSPHLPPLEDPKELRSVRIRDDGFANAWSDNLALAKRVGRKDFERELERIQRRYRLLKCVRRLDQDYLGGALLKGKRTLRPQKGRG